ncbi:MAG: hypothetical protein M1839_002865 [Geoglossum umbratile]|nr:MAG: hypothetical protein M1839_002865 [Geoglossum umbratile]
MEQAPTKERGGEPNPVDTTGLCLLSLDGGGVRGLSTLYVLKGLMAKLSQARQAANLPSVKPCEVFDLIGGTSTGGFIAIMLGRLEMDAVFEEKSSWLPVGWMGKTKAQFDSKRLKSAIEDVICSRGASTVDLFNNGKLRGCRTFVCTVAKETAGITCLRSYTSPDEHDIPATICEAALATSAATGFFDVVSIGARQFVDGAIGANNPVDEVEGEATNVWCSGTGDLKPLVKCFVSIGTGNPGKKAIENNMLRFLSKTLVGIATETEDTERKFVARWAKHFDEKRYFRFNVNQGLQEVDLAEYKEQGRIEATTDEFLRHQAQKFRVRDCVENLRQKQCRTETTFTAVEYSVRMIQLQTSSRKNFCNIPFLRNTQFVGRSSQLDKLEQLLFLKERKPKIAITGLGGVGKTQIALELAYRTLEKYPERPIFWIPATNAESLQQAYMEVAQQLQIPNVEKEQADVKKLLQRHLSQESQDQWLIIFDNADDVDMWIYNPASENQSLGLVDYLPQSSRGSIVFTTRSKKIAIKLAKQNVVEVSEMDEEAATQLLGKSLLDPTLLQNYDDTLQLLDQLTFLPLAIVQAAAYINGNGITLSDYLALLAEQEEDVIDLLSEEFEDDWRYRNVKNPVTTTWLISFEQIQRANPLAAEYLSFIACIEPRDVPQSLLPPAQSRKKEMDAIGTLAAYSFLSRRSADPSLDLHRLVHLATRNWLRREESLSRWTNKAVARLEETFPDNDHKNRSIWRAYLPHARYVLSSSLIEDGVQERTQLLWKYSMCLYSDGRYDEAEKSFFQVMETRKRELGTEHPSVLTSMANLASTFWNQGRWKEAEGLEMQVMETRKRVLGEVLQARGHSECVRKKDFT